jgi:hypothetical protein
MNPVEVGELILIVLGLAAFGAAVLRWGADTREGRRDPTGREGRPRAWW